jgi:hypothetical protein
MHVLHKEESHAVVHRTVDCMRRNPAYVVDSNSCVCFIPLRNTMQKRQSSDMPASLIPSRTLTSTIKETSRMILAATSSLNEISTDQLSP